jgi:acetyl esterase
MSSGRDDEAETSELAGASAAAWERLRAHPGVDPRLKSPRALYFVAASAALMDGDRGGRFENREQLLAHRRAGLAGAARAVRAAQAVGGPVPPPPAAVRALWSKDGLETTTHEVVSRPDGNIVQLSLVRAAQSGGAAVKAHSALQPLVFYIHGGGMASGSAFDPQYQAWARLLARQDVVVAMVDFRNSELASQPGAQVAPFPAGLNDCVSALEWCHAQAAAQGWDAERILVAGESGGGNLAIATALACRERGKPELVRHGIYALCPYLAGTWPQNVTNNGVLGTSHLDSECGGIMIELPASKTAALGYGLEAYEDRDPQAWPGFCSVEDLFGFPRTVISVNEFDPLRDEGIAFYRKLVAAGVCCTCKVLMGSVHGAELLLADVPHWALDCAQAIAAFARGAPGLDRDHLARL